ncbi:MAG: branched-chain amino acid ABC transporter permease [Thermodesulfobacteriota bacterium]
MAPARKNLLGLGAWALMVALAPHLLTNDYYVSTLIIGFFNAIIVVGLNLLLGYAGQISLGHGAFYGLAAYTSGILTATYGVPVEAAALTAIALTGLVAWGIGIPTLKLSGHSLAMATLGFGVIVSIVFNEAVETTGGPSGLTGIPRLALFGTTVESDLSYYYVTGAALTLVMALSLNLIQSRLGRALRAIHTSERAAEAVGVDIARYKLFVFVLSALFAALAGVLYVHYLSFAAPSSFGFKFSVTLIVMVVLGGMASVWGAVAGALFLTVLPEFLRAFEDIETLIFGGILILGMMFLPSGLAGGASKLCKALAGRLRRA